MMPYRAIRETRREERSAIALIVFVVLAAALATGYLEDPNDTARSSGPRRVIDATAQGFDR